MGIIKKLGFKGSVLLLVLVALLLLAFQNMDTISIRFLFWDVIVIKKIYLIFLLVGIGWVLGFLGGLSFRDNGDSNEEDQGESAQAQKTVEANPTNQLKDNKEHKE